MDSGRYCFVSNNKVLKYMVEKVKLTEEGLRLTEEKPDLSIINGQEWAILSRFQTSTEFTSEF